MVASASDPDGGRGLRKGCLRARPVSALCHYPERQDERRDEPVCRFRDPMRGVRRAYTTRELSRTLKAENFSIVFVPAGLVAKTREQSASKASASATSRRNASFVKRRCMMKCPISIYVTATVLSRQRPRGGSHPAHHGHALSWWTMLNYTHNHRRLHSDVSVSF